MFFAVKKNSLILIGLGTLMVIAAICIMIFGLNDDPAVTTNAEAVSYTHLDVYKRQVIITAKLL